MFAVKSLLAALADRCVERRFKGRLDKDRSQVIDILPADFAKIRRELPICKLRINWVRGNELAGERKQRIERSLHSIVAFLGAIAKAKDEIFRPFKMVTRFFFGFFSYFCDPLVGRRFQSPQHWKVPCVEQELPHQSMREVAIRLFDKKGIAERARIAKEGEIVCGPSPSLNFSGERQPHFRLADKIERDIGERNVLFKRRRMPAPGADTLSEDQRIVAHAEYKLVERRVYPGRGRHMCPTSSGMS